jgi:hypothetical protein
MQFDDRDLHPFSPLDQLTFKYVRKKEKRINSLLKMFLRLSTSNVMLKICK